MQDHTSSANLADLIAVQGFMRARATFGVGPFSILFSPGDRGLYANYAVPMDGAQPSAADIAAMEQVFRVRKRIPRLEYIPATAPQVEGALLAAEFTVEMRPPLMTCRAGAAGHAIPPPGFALRFVTSSDDLAQAAEVSAEAFGGAAADSQWMLGAVARGGRVLAACDRETGQAVGSGALVRPIGGVTEVVGIGVRSTARRQGLGQAIAGELAREAFRLGCEICFLSAAGETQAAIYARAGFSAQSPMLFMSKTG
jgi:GNAT superfamily N-acetyltransferase